MDYDAYVPDSAHAWHKSGSSYRLLGHSGATYAQYAIYVSSPPPLRPNPIAQSRALGHTRPLVFVYFARWCPDRYSPRYVPRHGSPMDVWQGSDPRGAGSHRLAPCVGRRHSVSVARPPSRTALCRALHLAPRSTCPFESENLLP